MIAGYIEPIEHQFEIPLPGRTLPRSAWSFLLFGGRIVAVDAGVRGGEGPVRETIERAGRVAEELATVVLTHGHPDHLGATATLVEMFDCGVQASAAEKEWIEQPESQLRDRPVPGFWSMVAGAAKLERTLADGDRVDVDDQKSLEVIATPGHSPGHIALWDESAGVLLSGDAVPVAGGLPIYDDAAETDRSLRRLLGLGPIATLLSAGDVPREGEAARVAIETGREVLRRVQEAVGEVARRGPAAADANALVGPLVEHLGLPPFLAGPMLARTVRAHLEHPLDR